jgi:hypothetical protein
MHAVTGPGPDTRASTASKPHLISSAAVASGKAASVVVMLAAPSHSDDLPMTLSLRARQ